MTECGFVWQKAPNNGEFPTLSGVDVLAIKKAFAELTTRQDVRVEEFYMASRSDHVELKLVIEIR